MKGRNRHEHWQKKMQGDESQVERQMEREGEGGEESAGSETTKTEKNNRGWQGKQRKRDPKKEIGDSTSTRLVSARVSVHDCAWL